MRAFSNLSLKLQLAAAVTAAGLVSLAVLTAVELHLYGREQAAETRALLDLAAGAGLDSMARTFEDIGDELETLAARQSTVTALQALTDGFAAAGPDAMAALQRAYIDDNANPLGDKDALADSGQGTAYDAAHAAAHARLSPYLADAGYYDLFLIDRDLNIVYSVEKERDFGASLADGALAGSGLADVARRAMQTRDDVLSSYAPYAPSAGQPAAFLAVPVFDEADAVVGVLAVQVSEAVLSPALAGSLGDGISGLYLVDGRGMLRASNVMDGAWAPAFAEDVSAVLGQAGEAAPVQGEIGLPAGTRALAVGKSADIAGVPYMVAALADTDALQAARFDYAMTMLALSAMSLAIIALTGYLFGNWLVRPISALVGAVGRLQKGDLTFDLAGRDRGDEIGALARAVDVFRQQELAGIDVRKRQVALGAACDSVSAALLMVDGDMNISFVNNAAISLMQKRIDDFRNLDRNFDPTKLMGKCIDVFHKGPEAARIRAILENPALLPMSAEIRIGRALLKLNISAIAGSDGGLVIEWIDATDTIIQTRMYETSNANQFIVEFGPDWSVVGMNRKFTQSTGHVYVRNPAIPAASFLDVSALGLGDHAAVLDMLETEGELSGRFSVTATDGEKLILLGTLTMIRDGNDRPYRIVLVARDITAEENARAEAAAERERTQRDQETVVENLKRGLAALSEGDLTASIDTAFPGNYEAIRQDFNRTAANLCRAVQSVAENAAQIQGETASISTAAESLAQRTEKQASTLEETASALDEITKSVATSSERAARADRLVADALRAASSGSQVVLETVTAMDAIEASSKQISRITSVIDDIAFQTNLLALNAGVEAARAGDAGRGFAVVASEVRALAQRSSAAAREISALIAESGSQVTRGVALAGQAGDALRGIEGSFAEIAREVADISTSSQTQSGSLVEINTAMADLDQVTQQNAAMFEETSAASHALRQESQALLELMRQFRTGATDFAVGATASRRGAPAPVAQAPAPASDDRPTFRRSRPAPRSPAPDADWSSEPRVEVSGARPPGAEPARTASTATARAVAVAPAAPDPAASADGWEDF